MAGRQTVAYCRCGARLEGASARLFHRCPVPQPTDYPGFVVTDAQRRFWDSLNDLQRAPRLAKGGWLRTEVPGFPGYGPPRYWDAESLGAGDDEAEDDAGRGGPAAGAGG